MIAANFLPEVIECCTTASSEAEDDSADVDIARSRLMSRFGFSEVQADAVLTLQLRRLTPAQIERMRAELADVEQPISRF